MATIKMKRGDTFSYTGVRKEDGAAVSITDYAIRSQIRDEKGVILATPTIEILTQSGATLGMFTMTVPYATTVTWLLGKYAFDVEFTHTVDAYRNSTDTISLIVQEDITRD